MHLLKIVAPWGGWILLFLLTWHLREHLLFRIDSWFPLTSQSARWEQIVQARTASLRDTPWQDERPLILMLGDSQVEMGNWYDLFQGRFAVRNAGLSQAKIKDVSSLANGISPIHPAMVLLFCGINDLGTGRTSDDTLKDYFQLLDQVCGDVARDRVMVLSIMPVARRRLADGSKDLNAKVQVLNANLRQHCEKEGIAFVDVSPAISNDGMLREDLTSDGLHLNPQGYHQLAASMQPPLLRLYDKAGRK